jgi:ParB-like chromosome segregation protein Spo0J
MNIQIAMFTEGKLNRKVTKIKLSDLPTNEELISPSPTKEFVQDMQIRGQLEPIHVNKVPKGYYVISGRRRVKTFRELAKIDPEKYATIDAIVYTIEEGAAILATSAFNNRKADNALSDLEAIQYVLALNPKAGKNEISRLTGIPIPRIAKRLDLLKLNSTLQVAVASGAITIGTAEKAAKLSTPMQENLVKIMAENSGRLSEADVAAIKRVRIADNAKQLVLPPLEMILDNKNDDVLDIVGYVIMDPEYNSFIGGLLQEKDIQNNLNQYRKDYPTINFQVMMVAKLKDK